MGFAVRVRSAGQKYGPTCHQRDRADVTEFVTLVRLSSLGQHVDVLALAGYKRRKSAVTAGTIERTCDAMATRGSGSHTTKAVQQVSMLVQHQMRETWHVCPCWGDWGMSHGKLWNVRLQMVHSRALLIALFFTEIRNWNENATWNALREKRSAVANFRPMISCFTSFLHIVLSSLSPEILVHIKVFSDLMKWFTSYVCCHERQREIFTKHTHFAGTASKPRITGADKFSSLPIQSSGDRKVTLHE